MTGRRPKIVFYDAVPDDVSYFTRELSRQFEVVVTPEPLTADTAHLAADASAISLFVTSRAPAEVLQRMVNVKLVACRSAGYDRVDTAYCATRGILVSNVPAYSPETVAEYAFLLMLAASRKLLPAVTAARHGDTSHDELVGHELFGKTVGVIGTGRIGRHAARLGVGFGMKVHAYDPYPQTEVAKVIGYTYVSLEKLLATSDYLTLHAPATKDSAHLLGQQAFGIMKRGVVLVNTARGTLISTKDLLDALRSGQVGAAGLDVLENEEVLADGSDDQTAVANLTRQQASELNSMPNVIMTHHNAFNSYEAVASIRRVTAENIHAWQDGQPINLVV